MKQILYILCCIGIIVSLVCVVTGHLAVVRLVLLIVSCAGFVICSQVVKGHIRLLSVVVLLAGIAMIICGVVLLVRMFEPEAALFDGMPQGMRCIIYGVPAVIVSVFPSAHHT